MAAAITEGKLNESKLHHDVQSLVRYLYDEARSALTSTLAVTFTANGLETPLGPLTVSQVEKGERILGKLHEQVRKKRMNRRDLERLTGEFYAAIPHRAGRTRTAVNGAVLNNLALLQQMQDTLQLMKDLLHVNGSGGVLCNGRVDLLYEVLGCRIEPLERGGLSYREVEQYVLRSQVKSKTIKVKALYHIRRDAEWRAFPQQMDNQRLLFYGARIQNWVGILSRGILLPRIVVSMGVDRTDEGWLGRGIYFAGAACGSAFCTSAGKKDTSFMGLARVALGKTKEYHEVSSGLRKPPAGYNSCHGVRGTEDRYSEFEDDEYVIYDPRQQRLEYLVEFTHSGYSFYD